MFFPIRSNNGAVMPFEQMPAAAGTYASGMVLGLLDDMLHKADGAEVSPVYLCVTSAQVTKGGMLTVAPISREITYVCDTDWLVEDSYAEVGNVYATDGEKLIDTEDKCFLVTAVLADSSVEGRFIN